MAQTKFGAHAIATLGGLDVPRLEGLVRHAAFEYQIAKEVGDSTVERYAKRACEFLVASDGSLNNGHFTASAYLSHQAVEQALKGALHFTGEFDEKIDKTHSLSKIVERVGFPEIDAATKLNLVGACQELDAYFSVRYTDKDLTREDAESALKNARKVVRILLLLVAKNTDVENAAPAILASLRS